MRTYMEEYNYWLASDVVDSKTKEELQSGPPVSGGR